MERSTPEIDRQHAARIVMPVLHLSVTNYTARGSSPKHTSFIFKRVVICRLNVFSSNAILPCRLFPATSILTALSPTFHVLPFAVSLPTAQQEEGLGREQRRKADDAIREAKALREELDRLKEDRTVGFGRRRKV